jgi:hypothetical protein
MSNRFHNKFHRQNHHSIPTAGYPDSSLDPIASYEQPFQGEFYSQGNIITTENLSALKYSYSNDGIIHNDLIVERNATVDNNLLVKGNLSVLGATTQLDTLVYATSALSVTNTGTGPAAVFKQTGNQPVAQFYDDDNTALFIDGRTATPGYIGIGTSSPDEKLHVIGNAKITGTIEAANIGTGEDNSVVVLEGGSGKIRTDEINPQVWDTTAKFVSAFDGALTVNRLTKAVNSNGINESIVYDTGTNVGIGIDVPTEKLHVDGNIKITGTATIETIATNDVLTSFVVENNGLLQKRIVNIAATDTTAVFVSASDGNLAVNRLTKATNSNGINESIIYDTGAYVGIGIDGPTEKLHVSGNTKITGTVEVPGIGTGTDNTVVILGADNKITTDEINPSVWDTTAKYVSAVDGNLDTGYIPFAENALGLDSSTIYQNGSLNIGIGTTSPGAKLSIQGTLSASSTVEFPNIGAGTDNSVVILDSDGKIRTDEINPQVWDTTAKYVSASDGALTVNRLTKATNSNGINESIVTDNGTLVSVGGNLSTTGTATIGTIASDATGTSVVVETAGLLRKRTLNDSAFDTTSVFVSASDGALSVNRLTKATNSNGINESIVYDSGTAVGIGIDIPSAKLDINGDARVRTNLTVDGNFTVLGTTSQLDTLVYTTSAVSITNTGTGPALTVTQTGTQPIAHFIDANGDDIIFADNGYVGLGISIPSVKLDVSGSIKTTGTATIGTIASDATGTSVVVETAGLLQKRTLNDSAFDTTSVFVSASDGALTVNRLTKATNSNGINESIVTDNGTLVSVGGNLSTTGTATIGTIANGTADSVLIQSAGLVQKRTIDSRAWGSSLVDGSGTANRVAYWTDSNTIAADDNFFFDGTNVGIGTTTPGVKLNVEGTAAVNYLRVDAQTGSNEGGEIQLKGAGANGDVQIDNYTGNIRIHTLAANNYFQIVGGGSTTALRVENGGAYIGNIAAGTTNSVIIESSGTLQKRSIDSRAWGSSLVDGTGTTNYIAKWSDADTIIDSQIFDNGTNVGIGTATPGAGVKLGVAGVIRSSSNTVTPAATTPLPSSNDVILNSQAGPVTITAFSGGVAGVTYTLTNKSTHAVTLDTSTSLFVRGGNSWASSKCTTTTEGYIVLPRNFSCSLRMDSATIGSAW